MTRVLVAGEQRMVREALVAALDREPDLKVVAQAECGKEAVEAARRYGPEVALVGAELCREAADGIETVRELARALPGCRSVVIGREPRPGVVRSALLAGALGFLHTGLPLAALVRGVHDAASGRPVGDPGLLDEARRVGRTPLSRREIEVLRRVATGADSADIARELSLSVGTVRNHLSAASRKLAARTTVDALRIVGERDWLRGG